MAQRMVLVDDIDGTEGKDIKTVTFGLHGASYEVDLNKKNTKKLEEALAPFLGVARKAGGSTRAARGSGVGRKPSGEDLNAIRNWAAANGKTVASKGRIAQAIKDEFYAATK